MEGTLLLSNGSLNGLSSFQRTIPTKFQVDGGMLELQAGVGVSNLQCPFQTSVSPSLSDKFKPEIAATVEKVGILCSLKVPVVGGQSLVGKRLGKGFHGWSFCLGSTDFDPALNALTVDVDVQLGELGSLEPIVKPYIIDPVKQKMMAILKNEIKQLVERTMQKYVPNIGSLM